MSSGTVLGLGTGANPLEYPETWINAPLAIGFSTVAAGIWSTRPDAATRRLAALYPVVGLASALVPAAEAWAETPAHLPGATFAAWLSGWVWALGAAPMLGIGILIYPDGRLPSRRWWPVLAIGVVASLVLAGSAALHPGGLEDDPSTTNPLGLGPAALWDWLSGIAFLSLMVAALLGLVAAVVRFRGAPRGGDVRRQISGFLLASLLVVVVASLPAGKGPGQLILALAAGIALPSGPAAQRRGAQPPTGQCDRVSTVARHRAGRGAVAAPARAA